MWPCSRSSSKGYATAALLPNSVAFKFPPQPSLQIAPSLFRKLIFSCKIEARNNEIESPNNITIKGILGLLMADTDGTKEVISLGIGDPTAHSCFRTTAAAQEAVVEALRYANFNGYSPIVGLPLTRNLSSASRSIATSVEVLQLSYRLNLMFQGAVPAIVGETNQVFFGRTIDILKQTSDTCYQKIREIDCISCPRKPQGSMAFMVKLDVSLLKDISDDIDFCFKLAKEESLIILPGS